MNIMFVAAEVAPLLKTGGLGDAAAALPAALRRRGHDVRIVMPRYLSIKQSDTPQHGPITAVFAAAGVRVEPIEIYQTTVDDTPVYLVDIPAAFDRPQPYGMADDDARFILFTRGVLNLMHHLQAVEHWMIDIVHANDWHTALLPAYLKTLYARAFPTVASVFTIHNLAYQGKFSPFTMHLSGLTSNSGAQIPQPDEQFNFMARGILHADLLTTVSPTYAREILTPEYGEGLDGALRERRDRLFGVLNGIDTVQYDPATDPHITANYTANDLDGKAACKAALQTELGLPADVKQPLIGMVTRLADQKGLDLLEDAVPMLLATDVQLVVLGTGEQRYERDWSALHAAHPERIATVIKFDPDLAQRIYAGSDMFLMPSRYEPGGIGQLISLRYGAVPIVRATGGLNDTIREGPNGNGFRFTPYSSQMLVETINRSLAAFRDPANLAAIRQRGMREDHSWNIAAGNYSDLYERARMLRSPVL